MKREKIKLILIYVLLAIVLILLIILTLNILKNEKPKQTSYKASNTPSVEINPFPNISDECTFDLTISEYNALNGPLCKGGYSRYNIKDVTINNKNLNLTVIYSDKNGSKSGLYINNTKVINKTDNITNIGLGIFDNKLFILDNHNNESNVLVYNNKGQNIYNLKETLKNKQIKDKNLNNTKVTSKTIDPNSFSFNNNNFTFKTINKQTKINGSTYTVSFNNSNFETPKDS